MTVRRFSLLAAVALLSAPALAVADTPPPAAGASATPAAPAGHNQTPDPLSAHIATLHQQLGITPAQETAWSAFTQVMRDNAARFHDAVLQRRAKLAGLSAPDNMQSYADLVTQRAQDLQALNMAFRTLYNGLSDAQKKEADTVFRHSDGHEPAPTH
jgi:periplasmic protein CpxP/Spy